MIDDIKPTHRSSGGFYVDLAGNKGLCRTGNDHGAKVGYVDTTGRAATRTRTNCPSRWQTMARKRIQPIGAIAPSSKEYVRRAANPLRTFVGIHVYPSTSPPPCRSACPTSTRASPPSPATIR